MEKRKPKIGEKLFLVTLKHFARVSSGRECTVTKTGRKYFYISPFHNSPDFQNIQFHIDSWCEKTEYASDYILYESEQEWKDACSAKKYHNAIRQIFILTSKRRDLTLSQLKQIAKILNITIEATENE